MIRSALYIHLHIWDSVIGFPLWQRVLAIAAVSALLAIACKLYCFYLRYSLFQNKIILTHTINKYQDL